MSGSMIGEVQQLVHRYWNALDRRDYAAVLGCVTEYVDWRLTSICRGREELGQALAERPDDFVVRHVVNNVTADGGPNEGEVFFLIFAFAASTKSGETAPYLPAPPAVIGDVRATVKRVNGRLLIARIASDVIFQASRP